MEEFTTPEEAPLGAYLLMEVAGRSPVGFLKSEEARLTRLSDGVYLDVSMFSDARCRMVGRDEAHAAGKDVREALHPRMG